MSFILRRMRLEDIPQVQEIEKEAFPTQWPPPSYKRELQNKLAHYIVLVDESESIPSPSTKSQENILARLWNHFFSGKGRKNNSVPQKETHILGMAGLWYMFDEAHITTLAVKEKYRRKGLGELLLIALIDIAQGLDARVVTLEVRVSNKLAQELYIKYGFKGINVRKGYYAEDGEDALIMTTDRISAASFQERLQNLKLAHELKWELDYKEMSQL